MRKSIKVVIVSILLPALMVNPILPLSDPVTVVAAASKKPAKVKNLRIIAKDVYPTKDVTKVTIAWDQVDGASGYRLYAKKTGEKTQVIYEGSKTEIKRAFDAVCDYKLTIQAYVKNGKKKVYGKKQTLSFKTTGILSSVEDIVWTSMDLSNIYVQLAGKDENLEISVDGGEHIGVAEYTRGEYTYKNISRGCHTFDVNLSEGKHSIEIFSEYYEPYICEITAKIDKTPVVSDPYFIINPLLDNKMVLCLPFQPAVFTSGAKDGIVCTVDGKALVKKAAATYEGVTGDGTYNQYIFLEDNNITKGTHTLKVTVPGFDDYEYTFDYE